MPNLLVDLLYGKSRRRISSHLVHITIKGLPDYVYNFIFLINPKTIENLLVFLILQKSVMLLGIKLLIQVSYVGNVTISSNITIIRIPPNCP